MNLLKKNSIVVIALLIIAFPFIHVSGAESADLSARELAPLFLSDVMGLDLTKYNIAKEGYGSDYPVYYGGEVKEEAVSFDLVSDQGNLSVMGIFRNGFISALNLYKGRNSTVYLKVPSTNAVNESRNMLQRYKTFAQDLGWNTTHIDQASTMLNNVSAAPSKDNLHMFNNIIGFIPTDAYEGNMKLETKENRVNWIYTEKGANITSKRISIDFGFDTLSFTDTWNLYKVGSLGVITEEEAKTIGWEAAKKYNLTFTYENGTTVAMTPKWSNVSEISFSMIPGQMYKMNQDNFVDPGSVTREPLVLYPQWKMIFYFEMIGGAAGIQVGVWGDTKEIAYISLYGYLGALGVSDTATSPEPQPENTPTNSPESLVDNSPVPTPPPTTEASPETTQRENPYEIGISNPSTNVFLASGAIATTVVAVAVALAVLKRRKK
jgi:hypothetical protein